MVEILATPAALAAIIGALTGVIGALATATITAVSSNRRERRSRLFSEKKATYVEYLRSVAQLEEMAIHGAGKDDEDAVERDDSPMVQLEIIASKRVRALHAEVVEALEGLVEARKALLERLDREGVVNSSDEPLTVSDDNFTAKHNKFKSAMDKIRAAMRKDLGES